MPLEYATTDVDVDIAYNALSEALSALNEWMVTRAWGWTPEGSSIRSMGVSHDIASKIVQSWGQALLDLNTPVSFGDRVHALKMTARSILAHQKMIKEGVRINDKGTEELKSAQEFQSYFVDLYHQNLKKQMLVSSTIEANIQPSSTQTPSASRPKSP